MMIITVTGLTGGLIDIETDLCETTTANDATGHGNLFNKKAGAILRFSSGHELEVIETREKIAALRKAAS